MELRLYIFRQNFGTVSVEIDQAQSDEVKLFVLAKDTFLVQLNIISRPCQE